MACISRLTSQGDTRHTNMILLNGGCRPSNPTFQPFPTYLLLSNHSVLFALFLPLRPSALLFSLTGKSFFHAISCMALSLHSFLCSYISQVFPEHYLEQLSSPGNLCCPALHSHSPYCYLKLC